MSRTIKIAGVGAIAGLMLTVAVISVTREKQSELNATGLAENEPDGDLARELARCRVLAEPDAGCDAAWAEHRRRFFGQDQVIEVPVDPDTFVTDAEAQGNGADSEGVLPSPSKVPAP